MKITKQHSPESHEVEFGCPHCDGHQQITVEIPTHDDYYAMHEEDCPVCNGRGVIRATIELQWFDEDNQGYELPNCITPSKAFLELVFLSGGDYFAHEVFTVEALYIFKGNPYYTDNSAPVEDLPL